eukprot:CAMPEP_0118892624 /NCGR_PEP_ID=MMETSP1166-20130328/2154_1 /TAXON_ID=1104430 /ORGANISM="Chrysoreinhardia sp, Strain CCMP3193" /LENGTH=295 /DNA_ID=CAMNT_0006831367 /DNA_START=73 /DNA_END=960 /DNA_ORIENTATION=-
MEASSAQQGELVSNGFAPELEFRLAETQQLASPEELAQVHSAPHPSVVAQSSMSAEELGDIGAAAQAAADAQINVVDKQQSLASLASAATQKPFHIGKKIVEGADGTEPAPLGAPLGGAPLGGAPLGGGGGGVVGGGVVVGAPAGEEEGARRTTPRPRRSTASPRSSAAQSSTGKTKGDYQTKYRATEKGRAAQRKAQEKYRRSEKGKTAQMRARKKWRETHPHQRSASNTATPNATTPTPAAQADATPANDAVPVPPALVPPATPTDATVDQAPEQVDHAAAQVAQDLTMLGAN